MRTTFNVKRRSRPGTPAQESLEMPVESTAETKLVSNINPRLQQIRDEQNRKIREKFIQKFGLNEEIELTEADLGYDTNFK